MNPTLFGALAILFYLAATAMLVRSMNTEYGVGAAAKGKKLAVVGLGLVAVGLHVSHLSSMCDRAGNVNFSFMSTSSLAAAVIVAILLLVTLAKPLDKLGVIVFPLASAMIALKIVLPEDSHVLKNYSWQMDLHILSSMLAYSFLNIAALQAGLLAFQDWRLRAHVNSRLARSLPPLQTMETLLFQVIGAGFILLTVSLVSGFLFVEDLFAQHLAHKTVLSMLAWIVFATLLGGRFKQGWRGQTAIRWTLSGFASLMLAYFGSKIVLELILKRV